MILLFVCASKINNNQCILPRRTLEQLTFIFDKINKMLAYKHNHVQRKGFK